MLRAKKINRLLSIFHLIIKIIYHSSVIINKIHKCFFTLLRILILKIGVSMSSFFSVA